MVRRVQLRHVEDSYPVLSRPANIAKITLLNFHPERSSSNKKGKSATRHANGSVALFAGVLILSTVCTGWYQEKLALLTNLKR